MTQEPNPKISRAPRLVPGPQPERYTLPARPQTAPAAVQDAHRQTTFLLGDELSVFERQMNMQLRIRAANLKARGAASASILTAWARVYSSLADACLLLMRGSYASCAPILRVALDLVAAQRSMVEDAFEEYEAWFSEALSRSKEHAATSIDIGRYKAASQLVQDDQLGPAYQALMELSMPHFGSSLLLAAPEASPRKVSPAFADGSFHLAWAELITRWLVIIAHSQIEVVASCGVLQLEKTTAQDLVGFRREVGEIAGNKRRCRVEVTPHGLVFHNFRRTPSGQPKRIILS